uniref:Cadherin N-terminal domain-containing protein n=1 Tax=Sinocyclocheilus anshuiensis TaxID=1608454 RepID=A0A671RW26_9TELE
FATLQIFFMHQELRWWIFLCFSLLVCFGQQVSVQIRYSVPEEVKVGSVVGNCANDLGLDVSTLADRRFRIVSGSNDALFQHKILFSSLLCLTAFTV